MRVSNFRLPKDLVGQLSYIMDKHHLNYSTMTFDQKNYDQWTWKQFRAKIRKFMSIPAQEKRKEKMEVEPILFNEALRLSNDKLNQIQFGALFIISISLVPTICEIFSFIFMSAFANVLAVAHIARKNISKLWLCAVYCVTNGMATCMAAFCRPTFSSRSLGRIVIHQGQHIRRRCCRALRIQMS